MPEATTVFLAPPSWEALERRLDRSRHRECGGDGPQAGHCEDELAAQDTFDRVVVNSELEFACSELVSLLTGH